jgi:hypothetical protein
MTQATPEGRPRGLRSFALVATDRPARVAEALAAHFGRRTPADETPGGYRLHFPLGRVLLTASANGLAIEADAPDEDALARVEDLLAAQIRRVAARDDLEIAWRHQ